MVCRLTIQSSGRRPTELRSTGVEYGSTWHCDRPSSPASPLTSKAVRRALVHERLSFAFSLSIDLDRSGVSGSTTIVPDVAGRHGTKSALCRSVGQRGRVGRGCQLTRWLPVAQTSIRWGVVSKPALDSAHDARQAIARGAIHPSIGPAFRGSLHPFSAVVFRRAHVVASGARGGRSCPRRHRPGLRLSGHGSGSIDRRRGFVGPGLGGT